jgi:shikimate kinase
MKKVAVLGNTGGGKSTLAKRLAELTRLPLYPIDLILAPKYRQLIADAAASKRVHHLKSPAEMAAFLEAIKREFVST